MSSRPFMLSPAAVRFISQRRRDQAKSATVPASREADADLSTQILRLAPAGALADGHGRAFVDAVRSRVFAARPPVATIVLDLSAIEVLDSSWYAVLVALNDSLRAGGRRMRLRRRPWLPARGTREKPASATRLARTRFILPFARRC